MTDRKQTRREHLYSIGAGAGTLTLASLAPTTEPGLLGWEPPANATSHSEDRWKWIVPVKGDDPETRTQNLDALEDELSGEDNTAVLSNRRHDAAGTLTTLAPVDVIGARNRDRWLADQGIATLDYIDASGIEINRTVTLADPLTPETSNAWSEFGTLESVLLSTLADGTPDSAGVAFDADMSEDALEAARKATAATSAETALPDTSSVTVAVADTGVSEEAWLDDANGNTRLLPASTNFVADDDPSGIGETADGNGHGNWCAACLAARTPSDATLEGYLPSADVLGLKALDDEGSGSLDDIAAAIRKAGDEGVDILNLSLGSPKYSTAIDNALEYAVEEGVVPIVAAGNDRQGTRWVATPASSDNSIAVGATTVAPPEEARSAYFSNVGPHNGITDMSGGETTGAAIDVAAPGCKIESASGDVLTGTSMAGPVVAGVAGLGVADDRITDLESAREELTRTAEPIPRAAQEEVGAGMPSAANLLSGAVPDQTQTEAETAEAATRGAAYQTMSGSWLFRQID
ncbi:S8 family serine peptidase [Natrinema pallidum]|uniref:Peptidase S8 and S53 subtilisin kexin sedolisin n=1 Tax=Natrinema pallidum TaxID=69527 RepID=A0A4P9TK79_9EURY|nr:S8 family serine peptidase [Natrinema pallidum]QCW05227.1 peptidase S8 and S53 subtilisin kexin sedolisin [Natrinema pallidum]